MHELVPVASKRPKRAAAAILPQYSADRHGTSLVSSWDVKKRFLEFWQGIRRGFVGPRLPFGSSLVLWLSWFLHSNWTPPWQSQTVSSMRNVERASLLFPSLLGFWTYLGLWPSCLASRRGLVSQSPELVWLVNLLFPVGWSFETLPLSGNGVPVRLHWCCQQFRCFTGSVDKLLDVFICFDINCTINCLGEKHSLRNLNFLLALALTKALLLRLHSWPVALATSTPNPFGFFCYAFLCWMLPR